MFVAVDDNTALFGQAGANTIGAFALLAPIRPRAQPPAFKDRRVGFRNALVQHHTFGIGQKHRTPRLPDHGKEVIQTRGGHGHEPIKPRNTVM